MEGLVFDPMVAKMVSFSENFDFHFHKFSEQERTMAELER